MYCLPAGQTPGGLVLRLEVYLGRKINFLPYVPFTKAPPGEEGLGENPTKNASGKK